MHSMVLEMVLSSQYTYKQDAFTAVGSIQRRQQKASASRRVSTGTGTAAGITSRAWHHYLS